MADLVIPIREYIGPSTYDWETDCYLWGSTCDDLRWAIEYAGYAGQVYERIVLEIGSCYGGSVDEGLAMFHYLQEQPLPVHTRILGTVASMGTILPLAGDTVEIAQTGQFMVHAPSNEFWGTSAEIKAGLKGLDGDTQALADIYVARTGADAATVAQWMSQDTWFTAAEALAAGLCTAVLPLRPKTAPAAPVLTDAQAKLRRTRFAAAVALADKRFPSTAKTPAAPAAAAPKPAPTPAPMATVTANKPKPRAAAPKPAPAAKPAQARKTLFQQLKDLFNDASEEEVAEAEASTAADVQSTVLADNNGTLYHDGALAVDSVVYTDDALTTTAEAGEYDTEDDQTITVGDAGVVTAIGAMVGAAAGTETAAVAALRREFADVKAQFATAQAEVAALKKAKPALPQARAARPQAEAPDPKTPPTTKPSAVHHSQL